MPKCYYCQNHLYNYEDDPPSWQFCECDESPTHCKDCHDLIGNISKEPITQKDMNEYAETI